MPMTFGCAARAAISTGSGTGNSAALCGCTPTVHQTFGVTSASATDCGACASRVPMVTTSPTPAAAARASTAGSSSSVK